MRKKMEYKYVKNTDSIGEKTETIIAELYLFSLPFRQINLFAFLNSLIGSCAEWLPFGFHVIGLLLWALNKGGRIEIQKEKRRLIKSAFFLMVFLNVSSIIMAINMQMIYGNLGSDNAFKGIAGMCIYFTQYFFMFLYNYRVFELVSIRKIKKILSWCCRVLLIIGFIQVLVINGIGIQIYDKLIFLGNINDSKHLPKLCLTGTEGASAGCIISIFVFPFLISRIIQGERKYIFELILWLVPLYFTYSTTAYILAALSVVFLVVFLVRYTNDKSKALTTLFIIILTVIFAILLITSTNILNSEQIDQIRYLLFEKASDKDNGSTISRTIPLLVNWGAFTEYPLLGVGNGLQGYFYEKYFPRWAYNAPGTDAGVYLERSRQGIGNGGIFIPGLLSGYGIVGCAAIIVFIWHCFQEHQKNRLFADVFYYSGIISFITFVVMGFQGDVYGMYYAWFMISIPFMTKQQSQIVDNKKQIGSCIYAKGT